MRNVVGALKGKLQLRMGTWAIFFDTWISTLFRLPNELPEGAVMDPISALRAARERHRSENGDIEFTMVFASSGALGGVRSRPKSLPKGTS